MDAKYGEFVGVENLHAAKVTADSAEAYTTETPAYLAPSAEISIQNNVNNAPQYYDNVAGFNYVTEGVSSITLTISGLPAAKMAELLGKYYDSATGRVIDDGQPEPPYYALSFCFNKGPEGKRFYQYLKGTFSGGEEIATTKADGNITVHTYQLTFTALNTTHKWTVNGQQKSMKRIFADSTDAAFTGNASTWFAAVQTPTSGASLAALSALTIGALTLTPTFAAGTLNYTASTANDSDTVTATPASGASAAIKVNGVAHTSGTAATWDEGDNTVEVTVTGSGLVSQTYTVTVTK